MASLLVASHPIDLLECLPIRADQVDPRLARDALAVLLPTRATSLATLSEEDERLSQFERDGLVGKGG